MTLFDIVICLGPNDKDKIETNIKYNKSNIIGYRNIYILSYDPDVNIEGCITIDEKVFGFNDLVSSYLGKTHPRNGWYLQQLLKLYAYKIEGILDFYLAIDADTFFLKPTRFFEDNIPLYNFSKEYVYPYFMHMQKLHPSFTRQDARMSGICHHMMFCKQTLLELFDVVENHHQLPFLKVFLENIDKYQQSGASEYELYFNYILMCNKPIKLRKLKFIDTGFKNYIEKLEDNDYIACHYYR